MRRLVVRSSSVCACAVAALCSGGCGGDADTSTDAGPADAIIETGTCVSVTGAGPEPWLDPRVVGAQFAELEDARMRVAVGGGGRVGVAESTIDDGTFDLTLPAPCAINGQIELQTVLPCPP